MPCHRPTPGFTPRAISQNGQNRKFFGLRIRKRLVWHSILSGKCRCQTGKRQFSSECAQLIGSYRSSPCVVPSGTSESTAFDPDPLTPQPEVTVPQAGTGHSGFAGN